MVRGVLVVIVALAAPWLSSCSVRQASAPVPQQVAPPIAVEGAAQAIVITGHDFWLDARVNFNHSTSSQLSSTFRAWLGNVELQQVQRVNDTTLTAQVPASLAEGTWDLTVEDPAGRQGTLAGAFTVTAGSVSSPHLSAEDAAGGSGQAIFDVSVAVGTPRTLFAVIRDADGGFVTDVVATWTLQGVDGGVAPSSGTSTTVTLTAAGLGTLTVDAPPMAPVTVSVHDPGSCTAIGPEGPVGDPSCSDGLDNDCDGKIDAVDPSCVVNTPPRAAISITPAVNVPNLSFSASATGTTDSQDAPAAL